MSIIDDCLFIKIRRYLEISKLYERCNMKRAASFYKWVSAGRVFRLMQPKQQTVHQTTDLSSNDVNLKRVLKKSISQMLEIFDSWFAVKQSQSQARACFESNGIFPSMKKRILNEIIQMHHCNANIDGSIKQVLHFLL
jgi:hypothetical protein